MAAKPATARRANRPRPLSCAAPAVSGASSAARNPIAERASISFDASAACPSPNVTVARFADRFTLAEITPGTAASAVSTLRMQPPQTMFSTASVTVCLAEDIASGRNSVARNPIASSAPISFAASASWAPPTKTVACFAGRFTLAEITPGTAASAVSTLRWQPPQTMFSTASVTVCVAEGIAAAPPAARALAPARGAVRQEPLSASLSAPASQAGDVSGALNAPWRSIMAPLIR